jgi:hypothetical protein
LKTITKTIEVVDKFIIEGRICSVITNFDYYGNPKGTVSIRDTETGESSEISVNVDFLNKLNTLNDRFAKVQMEIKILDN